MNLTAKIQKNILKITNIELTISFFIIILFVGFMIYKTYIGDVEKVVAQNAGIIDTELLQSINKSDLILSNKQVTSNFFAGENDLTENYIALNNLDEYINAFRNANESLESIFILYTDNENSLENRVVKHIPEDVFYTDTIKELSNNSIKIKWSEEEHKEVSINGKETFYISFFRSAEKVSRDFVLLEGRISYQTLTQNIISTDKAVNGFGLLPQNQYFSRIISRQTICGKYIYAVINMKNLMFQLLLAVLLIICVYILFLKLFAEISTRYSNAITANVNSFIESIQNSDNLLSSVENLDIPEDDEIFTIKSKFTDLLKQLDDAHKNLSEINQQKIRVELELLQTKFNPHLLYNALSALMWNAIQKKDIASETLIRELSSYFREILNNGNNITTISNEIEMIKCYVHITECSYNTKYQLSVDIDDTLSEKYIPHLILQPFIENAILHGLNGRNSRGEINIYGEKNKEYIIFYVHDNGVGMTEKKLRSIKSFDYSSTNTGYGIKNTLRRLRQYYGDECSIEINSVSGQGTTVIIRIKELSYDELNKIFQF